jgi:hypothetical protein
LHPPVDDVVQSHPSHAWHLDGLTELSQLVDVAESSRRGIARVALAHPARDERRDPLLDVKRHFVVELSLEARTVRRKPKQAPNPIGNRLRRVRCVPFHRTLLTLRRGRG